MMYVCLYTIAEIYQETKYLTHFNNITSIKTWQLYCLCLEYGNKIKTSKEKQ